MIRLPFATAMGGTSERAFIGMGYIHQARLVESMMVPQTLDIENKSYEFSGRRFYAMVGPEGQEHWSVQHCVFIRSKTNTNLWSAVTDKDENSELPGSEWELIFSEQNGKTTVQICIDNESLMPLEPMLAMGFQEGTIINLKNLEE